MASFTHHRHLLPNRFFPALLFSFFLLAGSATICSAQMLHLDPIPWFVPADSTSSQALIVEVSRFQEPKFDWSADRLQLMLILPAGSGGTFFVRIPHVTFDKGDVPLFSRWPWVQGEALADTFWTERRVSSFGQLELGVNSLRRFPLLGETHYGGAIGLPVGTDRLYPYSSVSFPLRVEIRKDLRLRRRTHLALEAGYLYNLDSGSDLLDPMAFANGWRCGAALSLYGGRNRRIVLDLNHENRDGHLSTLTGLEAWLPWSADGSWSLRVDRELAGSLDRYATWRFSVSWRFDNPRHRPGYEETKP